MEVLPENGVTPPVDRSGPMSSCPCAGVFTDLVAKLEAIRLPGRRRRIGVDKVCGDCHQKWNLTLARAGIARGKGQV